jgi:hypothetical protein
MDSYNPEQAERRPLLGGEQRNGFDDFDDPEVAGFGGDDQNRAPTPLADSDTEYAAEGAEHEGGADGDDAEPQEEVGSSRTASPPPQELRGLAFPETADLTLTTRLLLAIGWLHSEVQPRDYRLVLKVNHDFLDGVSFAVVMATLTVLMGRYILIQTGTNHNEVTEEMGNQLNQLLNQYKHATFNNPVDPALFKASAADIIAQLKGYSPALVESWNDRMQYAAILNQTRYALMLQLGIRSFGINIVRLFRFKEPEAGGPVARGPEKSFLRFLLRRDRLTLAGSYPKESLRLKKILPPRKSRYIQVALNVAWAALLFVTVMEALIPEKTLTFDSQEELTPLLALLDDILGLNLAIELMNVLMCLSAEGLTMFTNLFFRVFRSVKKRNSPEGFEEFGQELEGVAVDQGPAPDGNGVHQHTMQHFSFRLENGAQPGAVNEDPASDNPFTPLFEKLKEQPLAGQRGVYRVDGDDIEAVENQANNLLTRQNNILGQHEALQQQVTDITRLQSTLFPGAGGGFDESTEPAFPSRGQ